MTTKVCFKCNKEQDISNFYRHSAMKDGVVGKCKECNKKDVRDNRAEKIDYYKEYDKQRANNPNRVSAREEYSKTEAGKRAYKKAHKGTYDTPEEAHLAYVESKRRFHKGCTI